jgi:hypothetical protein
MSFGLKEFSKPTEYAVVVLVAVVLAIFVSLSLPTPLSFDLALSIPRGDCTNSSSVADLVGFRSDEEEFALSTRTTRNRKSPRLWINLESFNVARRDKDTMRPVSHRFFYKVCPNC